MKRTLTKAWQKSRETITNLFNNRERKRKMMQRGQAEPNIFTTTKVFRGLVRQFENMPLNQAQRKYSLAQTRRLFKITMDRTEILDEKKRQALLTLAIDKTRRIDQLKGINRNREEDAVVRRIEVEMTGLLGGPKKTKRFFEELKKVSSAMDDQEQMLIGKK